MKLNLFYNKINSILIFICIFFGSFAFAQNNIEKQVKDIALQLRCMTCQNQSIYDSDADFSKDIKKNIAIQLKQGKNEREIISFLVDRYGEYIVFKPLLNKKNIFLWVFPFALFLFSLIFIVIHFKKNNSRH